ncbi:MAG: carbohydrate ABC transporter permease [Planctomycetota bacterium]|jgi:ABC-type sugar transport system permease subunit
MSVATEESGSKSTKPETPSTDMGFLTYKRREKFATFFFLLPALFLIAVFSYVSFLLTLGLSFFGDVTWLPTANTKFVGFANYVKVWNYDLFRRALWNVSLFVVLYVGIALVLGLIIASLMEQKIKGIGFYRVAFFMPIVVSSAATAWIFRVLFSRDIGIFAIALERVTTAISRLSIFGWNFGALIISKPIDNLLGDARSVMTGIALMVLWGGLGYWILIYTAGLRSIDPELYESAMIDGAGFWSRTWHITVPLVRPVILFLSITGVIRAFQLFAIPMILPAYGEAPGGPDDATQVPILLIYNIAFGQRDFGYASALAATLFLILFVITLIQAKVGRLSSPA